MRRSAGSSKSGTDQRVEQRREPRQSGEGDVRFLIAGSEAETERTEVCGQLLDRSPSGFRAEHGFPGLTCGQIVEFRIKGSAKRQARVAWTRIMGARVETGFFILR
jgi:hypothetical protein